MRPCSSSALASSADQDVAHAGGGELVLVVVVVGCGPPPRASRSSLTDSGEQVELGLPADQVVLVVLGEVVEHLLAARAARSTSGRGRRPGRSSPTRELAPLQLGADQRVVDLAGQGQGGEGGVERALAGAPHLLAVLHQLQVVLVGGDGAQLVDQGVLADPLAVDLGRVGRHRAAAAVASRASPTTDATKAREKSSVIVFTVPPMLPARARRGPAAAAGCSTAATGSAPRARGTTSCRRSSL